MPHLRRCDLIHGLIIVIENGDKETDVQGKCSGCGLPRLLTHDPMCSVKGACFLGH